MKQKTGQLTTPRIQKSTARQRAFLKLGAFFLSAFLFIMLACMPSAPPPFSIDLLVGPSSLLSGEEAEYTFLAQDNRIEGMLSSTKIGVTGRFLLANGKQSSVELNLSPTLTTDQHGEFQLLVKMPDDASHDDWIELVFEPQDEEFKGRATVSLSVMPEVSLFLLNEEGVQNAGPVTNMLVQVFDNRAQQPLPNVPWRTDTRNIQTETTIADSGVTNGDGVAEIQIDSRDAALIGVHYDFGLIAETERGEFSIWLQGYKGTETFDVLLSTDKPIYQPGQTIHVRALALMKTSMKAAADSEILLQLIDPNGTVVSQTEVNTSDYGVSSADFALDSQIGSGDYTLRAETAFGIYNRTVEIKPYMLPRFEIAVTHNEPFVTPGSTASGTIDASYFFGKPVSNGTVRIVGSAPESPGSPDVVDVFTVEGETDENGRYPYAIDLPDTLIGQEAHEAVTVDLNITVIDSANHAEETDTTFIVAQQPLVFEAVAESGTLRTGIENIVYIQASTPDGRPAQALLSVDDGERIQQIETDQFGLAQISVFPPQGQRFLPLEITARGLDRAFSRVIDLSIAHSGFSNWPSSSLLIRLAKPEFVVGEPINVEVLLASDQETSNDGELVLIEVKKHGYLYSSQAVSIFGGRGHASIVVDPSLIGTVEISAKLLSQDEPSAAASFGYSSGYPAPNEISHGRQASLAQDCRLVLINPSAMQVNVNADADQYSPGESATLDIQLNQDGAPVQGMLGVAIVDESVFALGAQDPAFARTYFLIDKELIRPHYGIDGFAPFGGEPSPYVDHSRTASVDILDNQSSATAHIVPPLSWRKPGGGNVDRSRQTALFGALAQELQWTATAHASAATVSVQTGSNHHSALPIGPLLMVMAAAAVVATARIITTERNRKQSTIVIGIIATSALIWTACSAPASAPPAEMPAPQADAPTDSGEAFRETGGSIINEQSTAKPRLRQFFPETLLWLPEVETDASGRAHIDLAMADSITTWRVSVIASDKEGNLGSAQLPMRVFQDFFVEPGLPLYLTEGDEIDVPVSIFNYLEEAQTVELEITEADWFEPNGEFDATVIVAANEVAATYVPIRVLDAGVGDFQLTATGMEMSDAVVRQVTVSVNGERQEQIINNQSRESTTHEIIIDERAHADESTITLRFYPSPLSEMVSGLEAMLQEPNGCFEQTSSTNYPNVMILDYLRKTGQNKPNVENRASGLAKKGYQRLLTFEVDNNPGAFSLWGDPPPQLMLTAYGLMQFSDQSRVTYVDPALIERIAAYLIQHQNADGSWTPNDSFAHGDLGPDVRNDILATAFITWALAESGQDHDSIRMGVNYLANAVEQQQVEPNYALAMTVNALIAAGDDEQQIEQLLEQLVGAAIETDTGAVQWTAGRATYLGGYAEAADVETSAMAAIALLKSGQQLEMAGKAIQGLQEARGSRGYYYSTQATVLVLKALTLSEQWRQSTKDATVTVSLNGQESQHIDLSEAAQDRPVEIVFANVQAGDNQISLSVDSEVALSYQIMAESYLPWDVAVEERATTSQAAQQVGVRPIIDIAVTYDANKIALNESITVEAEMHLLADEPVANIMAEIGLPPGFRPSLADLDQLVGQTVVADYEIRRDRLILYLSGMETEQTYAFTYDLTATIPGTVQAPPSFGYPYYASNLRTIDAPQTLVVTE